jgi:mannose-6-phosphate isomerase-like protein (cupin superfamily)
MSNYSVFEAGSLNSLDEYTYRNERLPFAVDGKLFLRDKLSLTGAEISLNKMPMGKSIPFLHHHGESEEVYIFVSGKGQFQVDGEIFPVSEGTSIRVAPEGDRGLRNIGEEDLIFIVIQVPEGGYDVKEINDGEAASRSIKWE